MTSVGGLGCLGEFGCEISSSTPFCGLVFSLPNLALSPGSVDSSSTVLSLSVCKLSLGLLSFSLEIIGESDSDSEDFCGFVRWTGGLVFFVLIRGAFILFVTTSSSELSESSLSEMVSGDLNVFAEPDVDGFLLWLFFGNSLSSAEVKS